MSEKPESTPAGTPEAPQSPAVVRKAADTVAKRVQKPAPAPPRPTVAAPEPKNDPQPDPSTPEPKNESPLSVFGWDL